ncbi:MmgE/PrpD family protein, partial [Gammaproteobacteria bacterium AH-315-E17]|nr:MmgE/PrpD family protein [Gammaproteobacteria bacterium AH-315-E17]
EDMHTTSVSHLGVVIFPALMAMSQHEKMSGRDFLLAAACGYEAGAIIGKRVIEGNITSIHRPTGIMGPIAATTALSKGFKLNHDETISAIGIATNTCSGFNEWAEFGSDDMYLHAGFAARNSLTSVSLAKAGLSASQTALDGKAGLFASLAISLQSDNINFFSNNDYEVMEVFFKPSPSCNYTQTPCQVALSLTQNNDVDVHDIESIKVYCTEAAIAYPGCNGKGPFLTSLHAKMSIPFSIAGIFVHAKIEENNFHFPVNEDIPALIKNIELIPDETFTAAYPAKQGAAIELTLRNGKQLSASQEDLIPASMEQVKQRFIEAATHRLGKDNASELQHMIEQIEQQDNMQNILNLVNQGLGLN